MHTVIEFVEFGDNYGGMIWSPTNLPGLNCIYWPWLCVVAGGVHPWAGRATAFSPSRRISPCTVARTVRYSLPPPSVDSF